MLGVLEHLVADVVLLGQQPVADLPDVVRVHVVHHVLLQRLLDGGLHLARLVGLVVVPAAALGLGVVLERVAVLALEDQTLVLQHLVLVAVQVAARDHDRQRFLALLVEHEHVLQLGQPLVALGRDLADVAGEQRRVLGQHHLADHVHELQAVVLLRAQRLHGRPQLRLGTQVQLADLLLRDHSAVLQLHERVAQLQP